MFKAIFVWSRIGNPDMHCIPNSRFRHGNLIYGRCSISANDSPVNLEIHLFVQGAQSNAIHILVHHLIVNCFSTELPRSWKQYYLSFYNSRVIHISVINSYLLKIKIHTNGNFDFIWTQAFGLCIFSLLLLARTSFHTALPQCLLQCGICIFRIYIIFHSERHLYCLPVNVYYKCCPFGSSVLQEQISARD